MYPNPRVNKVIITIVLFGVLISGTDVYPACNITLILSDIKIFHHNLENVSHIAHSN